MKQLSAFILILLFTINSFGSSLMLKTTKELQQNGELLTVDISKYKKVRIGVLLVSTPESKNPYEQNTVRIYGIEAEDLIFTQQISVDKDSPSNSILLDIPPPKIKLTASKAGTYKIFIWVE